MGGDDNQEMCLAVFDLELELPALPSHAQSTEEETHKLSDSTLGHTETLFQSSEEDRTWTEVRRMMEVSFYNSHAIYAESEAEK